jgi:hypothetical protein
MRLCGILAEGEQPSPESAQDALSALNQMLDSWSISGCTVHSTQLQTILWASGVSSKTVGPTGTFVGTRPVSVGDSTYYSDGSGIDYSISIINEADYNGISWKNLNLGYPAFLYANMTMPDTTITLFPTPSDPITLYLSSVIVLTQPAALITVLVVPPGYMRAFRYGLAVEIAAEFGIEAPVSVQKIAWKSLAAVKKVNRKNAHTGIMRLPAELTRSRSNIYEG